MVCPKCGTELPNGSKHCSACGAPVAVPAAAPVYAVPLTKKEFLRTKAGPKAKKYALIALVVFAIAAILMTVAAFSAVNKPIYDIALVSGAAALAGEDTDDIEDMFDEIDNLAEKAEDALDRVDDISKKDKKLIKKFIDSLEACADTPSLKNMSDLMGTANSVENKVENEAFEDEFEDVRREMGMPAGALKALVYGIFFAGLLVVLFIVLAFVNKRTGFAVTAAILSVPFTWIFSGFFYMAITLAAIIVLAVFLSKITTEYKAFLRSSAQ